MTHERGYAAPAFDAKVIEVSRELDARRRASSWFWLSTQEQIALARLGKALLMDVKKGVAGKLASGGTEEAIAKARSFARDVDYATLAKGLRFLPAGEPPFYASLDVAGVPRVLWLHNKADLLPHDAPPPPDGELRVSAATGQGMDALHACLRRLVLGDAATGEGEFTARARHVEALGRAGEALDAAALPLHGEALDLAAEALRDAHHALGDITGRVDADALLGHIFSSFCIGK